MKIKQNLFLKILAFLLALVFFAAAAAMGIYQVANFSVLWEGYSPFYGYTNQQLYWQADQDIQDMIYLYDTDDLGLYSQWRLEELEEAYAAEHTNLRWQVKLDDSVLYGNVTGEPPERTDLTAYSVRLGYGRQNVSIGFAEWGAVIGVNYGAQTTVRAEDWLGQLNDAWQAYLNGVEEIDLDCIYLNELGYAEFVIVETLEGQRAFGPTVRAVLAPNEYGYRYDLTVGWVRESGEDRYAELVMWLDPELSVNDAFKEACVTLTAWKNNRELALAVTALLAVLGLLCTIYLCVTCGHKKDRDGIYLNWFHYIPGDLLLAVWILGVCLLGIGAGESLNYYYDWPLRLQMALATLCITGIALLVISFLVTFVARCKGRVLLRHTVIGWICIKLWHLCRAAVPAIPLVWKAALGGATYLILSVILVLGGIWNSFWLVTWFVMTLAVIFYLCWWALQWKKVRRGACEIISGNTDHHIDNSNMPPDLRAHADELNNLGQAIGAAVEERMRSEHFKAELITNVSHDLKTPLTSIISYVDLLKKEEIHNPKAQEYIEVLDRKSQRLKKLTEDLVEASKASTGALTVLRERLDLIQLADQALAEYEERLSQHGLSVVRTLPGQPVWVMADGRHLWRVIDNLLSNCAKYALEGTRVYVEVQSFSDCARLSVKNISRDELNIPAEQLTERFVRGDESRTMEGSGLGLSIARSLTDLQQGSFDIAIDGDLFKATVTLPLAPQTELI